jgi:uncharacterized protein (DUF433 family)
MTEKERDQRDLVILEQFEVGASVKQLLEEYPISRRTLKKLMDEVLDND